MVSIEDVKQAMLNGYYGDKPFSDIIEEEGLSYDALISAIKEKKIRFYHEEALDGTVEDGVLRKVVSSSAGFGIEFRFDEHDKLRKCKLFNMWVHNHFTNDEVLSIVKIILNDYELGWSIKRCWDTNRKRVSDKYEHREDDNNFDNLKIIRYLGDWDNNRNRKITGQTYGYAEYTGYAPSYGSKKIDSSSKDISDIESFTPSTRFCMYCNKLIAIGVVCDSCIERYSKKRRGFGGYPSVDHGAKGSNGI